MGTIGEGGSITPEMRAFYKEKFAESVELFEKSLEGYQSAEMAAKRERFKGVMEQAIDIMNKAAKAGLTAEAKAQKEQLENDFNNLVGGDYKKPLSEEDYERLSQDITNLRDSI